MTGWVARGRVPDFISITRPKTYRDFRKMLDEEDKNTDAVAVATTDHPHPPQRDFGNGRFGDRGCHFRIPGISYTTLDGIQ